MARCREHYEDPDNTGFELNCDLDDGHEPVLKDHYDGLKKLFWHQNEVPSPVPYTPTGPLPAIRVARK